jgi:hypothetical protein
MRVQRFLHGGVCLLMTATLALAGRTSARADDLPAEQVELFEKKIRPVLVEHCYQCHSAQSKTLQGKLLLDSREGMRHGGDSGPAIVPGKPGESLLLLALRYEASEMPPKGKLPEEVIADFERWIELGAIDPREGTAAVAATIDFDNAREFWSFQKPHAQGLPTIENSAWPARRADAFIAAKLAAADVAPAPAAARRTWLRRATFDLIGLPPTPEEIEAFQADDSPDAFERVVDRLLASPQHGERVARLWLDLVRFAEDQAHIVGKNSSLFYPNAYLYRDWVIGAINRDLPYDEFVRLQLAADLVEGNDSSDLAALGLLGLGPKYYGRGSLAVQADEWEDRVDVVGRGLLGLTLACARCHDHKFDPIGTEDYYALAGVFASTAMFNRPLRPEVETKETSKKDAASKFENGGGTGGEAKNPEDALHIVRDAKPLDLNIFLRGNVANKGPLAPRHFPRVLCDAEPATFTQGSGRRELAEQIASRDSPLTARVIVNRLWGLYVGQPLVATTSNFGTQGAPPTHPELLDDLAVRFMQHGWSLKWLTREVVLSSTYRQASFVDSSSLAADPDNRLLSRMPRRRLSVEQWRDAVLAVTGRLENSIGGKSLDPQDPDQRRRTVYSHASRLELNPLLAAFDYPDPNVHADHRAETITPLQKMFVLNSPFMVAEATALADRLAAEFPASDDADAAVRAEVNQRRIERAYALLFGRAPAEQEQQLGRAFLSDGDDWSARWPRYAQALLASSEFLYVD